MPPFRRSGRACCRLVALSAAGLGLLAGPTEAQLIDGALPHDVPGLDAAAGVSVTSRIVEDMEWQQVRLGPELLHPEIDQSIGYDSAALSGRRGSFTLDTIGSLTLSNTEGGEGFAVSALVEQKQDTADPSQSETDWSGALGEALPTAFGKLTLAAAHLSLHETDTDLDAPVFDRPLPYSVDVVRAAGDVPAGSLDLRPSLGISRFNFGSTTIDGLPAPQSYRDRLVLDQGLTIGAGLSGADDPTQGLLILRSTETDYTGTGEAGSDQPSRNSMGGTALVGIAHDLDGLWGWRIAIGLAGRSFNNVGYGSQLAPVAEAAVIWQPTERTTWSAALLRQIEDASSEGIGSYVETIAGISIDHELRRALILHAGLDLKDAAYQGGGAAEHRHGPARPGVADHCHATRQCQAGVVQRQRRCRRSLRAGGLSGRHDRRHLIVRAMRCLLGLDFADLDAVEVAACLAARPAEAGFVYLVTPNADHLVRLQRQPELQPVYRQAALCCLDSTVVAHLATRLGLQTPQVATGADISKELLTNYLQPGDRLTVIGLARSALPALLARLPGVRIAHHAPPLGFAHNASAFAEALDFALAHPARFTFIAVGSPAQERLAAAIAATGQSRGYGLCIGAALDFFVGLQPRAPYWMRRLGLEWLYRLWREPRRLARRYLLDDPAILPLLVAEWRGKPHRSPGASGSRG
jgi:N-acetylglucosaminyldiphosphoundecaprenol N-acetyl-beta-D-mannosaminyltransferase